MNSSAADAITFILVIVATLGIFVYNYTRMKKENAWKDGYTREEALASVGKGWAHIINFLYDMKPKHIQVIQVKEKFGTLRFYTAYTDEEYERIVDFAEKTSGTTCEDCGNAGRTRYELSWYRTLCDSCLGKYKSKEAQNNSDQL